MPKSEQTSIEINNADTVRQQWISVAAYYKAEAIGFEQGKDLDNWLEAELEYTEFQIQSFMLRCQEDGEISINCLQELAESIGVPNTTHMTTKLELIREIQKASHHRPCFQSTYLEPCAITEPDCPWGQECKKLIALWHR